MNRGFTLIELSIVLVIIGLITGGILVGQDLIAAGLRAQISQIEKYNTAVHTFQAKYGYIPGDMPDPQASSFGFIARGNCQGYTPCPGYGMGDGNGVLQGDDPIYGWPGAQMGNMLAYGEQAVFWVDLSAAGLVDGTFKTATFYYPGGGTIGAKPDPYMPAAKVGQGNYVYAWSGGYQTVLEAPGDNINYFGVSALTSVLDVGGYTTGSTTGLTVQEAYNIDQKVDDGLPQSGKVMAIYVNSNLGALGAYAIAWAKQCNTNTSSCSIGASQEVSFWGPYLPTTAATNYSTVNCYDNADANGNGVTGAAQRYSLKNASSLNCALSFQFN